MNPCILILGLLVSGAPRIEIPEPSFDFGYAYAGEDYRHTFWVYNRGDAPLKIRNVRVFCNCSVAEIKKTVIPPKDSASFDFIFDTQGFFGECVKWAYILSNDPKDSLVKINVTVRLYEDYSRIPFEVEPEYLYFNRIDSLRDEVALKIRNASETTYSLRIEEIPRALENFDFPPRSFAPGEEIKLILHPGAGIKDPKLFKSSLTFEAYTPTQIVRFSLPLHLSQVP